LHSAYIDLLATDPALIGYISSNFSRNFCTEDSLLANSWAFCDWSNDLNIFPRFFSRLGRPGERDYDRERERDRDRERELNRLRNIERISNINPFGDK
jgi:hypothetical protein